MWGHVYVYLEYPGDVCLAHVFCTEDCFWEQATQKCPSLSSFPFFSLFYVCGAPYSCLLAENSGAVFGVAMIVSLFMMKTFLMRCLFGSMY